jgi:hypothetical protein
MLIGVDYHPSFQQIAFLAEGFSTGQTVLLNGGTVLV